MEGANRASQFLPVPERINRGRRKPIRTSPPLQIATIPSQPATCSGDCDGSDYVVASSRLRWGWEELASCDQS